MTNGAGTATRSIAVTSGFGPLNGARSLTNRITSAALTIVPRATIEGCPSANISQTKCTDGFAPACDALGMAFTVNNVTGDSAGRDYYDDGEDFAVQDFGVLAVSKDGELVKLYSPSHWTTVIPGERKPTVSARRAVVI